MGEQHKLQTAWQLAEAVQHLHDRHMLKLDIRPSIVLFNKFGDVVLSGLDTLRQMQTCSQSLPATHGTNSPRYGILTHSTSCLQLCCILCLECHCTWTAGAYQEL